MNYEACITIEKFEASDPNNHEKKSELKLTRNPNDCWQQIAIAEPPPISPLTPEPRG